MTTDEAETPHYQLRIAGLPFGDSIASLLLTVQLTALFMAGLALVLWVSLVIGSTYHPWMFAPYGGFWEYFSVDWYPGLFLMAIGMALLSKAISYVVVEETD